MPESSLELVRAAVRVAMERFEAMHESCATVLLSVAWDGTPRRRGGTRPETAVDGHPLVEATSESDDDGRGQHDAGETRGRPWVSVAR